MTVLLTEILQSLLLLAALALPVELLAPAFRWPLYALFVFTLALLYLVRLTSRRLWQFLLPGLALLSIPFWLPFFPDAGVNVLPRLVLGLGLAVLVVRAAILRWNSRKESPPVPGLYRQSLALFFLFGLDVVALALGSTGLSRFYFHLAVVYLVLALLRWHQASLDTQMERFAATPAQPAFRVIRFNRFLLLGALIGSAAFLLLSPLLDVAEILLWVGQRLLDLLRFLVSLLRPGGTDKPTPTQAPEPTEPAVTSGLPIEPSETPAWLQFLLQAIQYLLFALIVAALVAAVVYGIYRLLRRFYDAQLPDSDRREFLRPVLIDRFEKQVRRVRRLVRLSFDRSPGQRIRRAGFRLIESQVRHGLDVQPSRTMRVLIEDLDTERYSGLDEVLELYEKARYGHVPCTEAEAGRMQRLVRGLSSRDLVLKKEKPGTKGKA